MLDSLQPYTRTVYLKMTRCFHCGMSISIDLYHPDAGRHSNTGSSHHISQRRRIYWHLLVRTS